MEVKKNSTEEASSNAKATPYPSLFLTGRGFLRILLKNVIPLFLLLFITFLFVCVCVYTYPYLVIGMVTLKAGRQGRKGHLAVLPLDLDSIPGTYAHNYLQFQFHVDQTPFSDLCWHQEHMNCTYMHAGRQSSIHKKQK